MTVKSQIAYCVFFPQQINENLLSVPDVKSTMLTAEEESECMKVGVYLPPTFPGMGSLCILHWLYLRLVILFWEE